MPNKTTKKKTKATSPKKAQAKKTQTKKTSAASSAKAEQIRLQERKAERQSFFVTQVLPYILIVAAIFLVVCYFTGGGDDPGVVNGFIYNTLTGLFAGAAFILPVFLLVSAIMSLTDKTDASSTMRYTFAGISMLLLSALLQLITPAGVFSPVVLFKNGTELSGGGVIGGLIGELFLVCFKEAGSYVLVIAFLILSVLLMIGLTPKYIYVYIAYTIKTKREEAAQRKAEEMLSEPIHFRDPDAIAEAYEARQAEKAKAKAEKPEPEQKRRKPKFDTDVPVEIDIPEEVLPPEDNEPPVESVPVDMDTAIFNEVLERTRSKKSAEEIEAEKAFFEGAAKPAEAEMVIPEIKTEEIKPEGSAVSADSAAILDQLADAYLGRGNGEAESLSVERSDEGEITSVEQVAIEIPKPEYKFPPIDLLSEDKGSKAGDIRGELHDNAAKLVRVLGSFNVKTKIVGVSRGPTITRYELLPEAGTRVRSIANLVDDIALNLATTGVRIEAPIPGKAAVGIEVPNKVAETVYLRSLIETKEFSESASKISTALGKNVGGEPVFMDIKKMPHLLIAGATGMGKSVCINCLLVSMLYKASPDEVKLMLIDPKKVEFNIYNGLPHLLVPVVSDPKKAAGSLNWAVNEMERRFGLIEAVGVRDIASYNEITKNDPDYEYMPQIVIVIDELADLMSTAPDDVETSIARLAAKARAAGMHLIIGTQRPSVDVITGVIKANIPSRIACTVASQVDSRTIIDRSGAENLIGRGDMLYSPVGSSKPMRVQGAFVSDKEVDEVVSFIKSHNVADGNAKGDEIMKEIEAAAAMCGAKKGSGAAVEGGGDGDGDPLVRQALDVAFESGKISTSLLQRRLSIGYGRAAKIIDRLEELGYVSAPEGQKPRQLLISKQEYMEMVLRDEDPS